MTNGYSPSTFMPTDYSLPSFVPSSSTSNSTSDLYARNRRSTETEFGVASVADDGFVPAYTPLTERPTLTPDRWSAIDLSGSSSKNRSSSVVPTQKNTDHALTNGHVPNGGPGHLVNAFSSSHLNGPVSSYASTVHQQLTSLTSSINYNSSSSTSVDYASYRQQKPTNIGYSSDRQQNFTSSNPSASSKFDYSSLPRQSSLGPLPTSTSSARTTSLPRQNKSSGAIVRDNEALDFARYLATSPAISTTSSKNSSIISQLGCDELLEYTKNYITQDLQPGSRDSTATLTLDDQVGDGRTTPTPTNEGSYRARSPPAQQRQSLIERPSSLMFSSTTTSHQTSAAFSRTLSSRSIGRPPQDKITSSDFLKSLASPVQSQPSLHQRQPARTGDHYNEIAQKLASYERGLQQPAQQPPPKMDRHNSEILYPSAGSYGNGHQQAPPQPPPLSPPARTDQFNEISYKLMSYQKNKYPPVASPTMSKKETVFSALSPGAVATRSSGNLATRSQMEDPISSPVRRSDQSAFVPPQQNRQPIYQNQQQSQQIIYQQQVPQQPVYQSPVQPQVYQQQPPQQFYQQQQHQPQPQLYQQQQPHPDQYAMYQQPQVQPTQNALSQNQIPQQTQQQNLAYQQQLAQQNLQQQPIYQNGGPQHQQQQYQQQQQQQQYQQQQQQYAPQPLPNGVPPQSLLPPPPLPRPLPDTNSQQQVILQQQQQQAGLSAESIFPPPDARRTPDDFTYSVGWPEPVLVNGGGQSGPSSVPPNTTSAAHNVTYSQPPRAGQPQSPSTVAPDPPPPTMTTMAATDEVGDTEIIYDDEDPSPPSQPVSSGGGPARSTSPPANARATSPGTSAGRIYRANNRQHRSSSRYLRAQRSSGEEEESTREQGQRDLDQRDPDPGIQQQQVYQDQEQDDQQMVVEYEDHPDGIEDPDDVSNLEPHSQQQFRVVAKNAAGFGVPSTPSAVVQLRPVAGADTPIEQGVPHPPSCPRVVRTDVSSVQLAWEPPVSGGAGGPVAGYTVEYRPLQAASWLQANDYLITKCSYEVAGLRPGGEYEFRVLARNADGYSEPSRSSGIVAVLPRASEQTTAGMSHIDGELEGDLSSTPSGAQHMMPPSQPQVVDIDSDWVTLMWAPPPAVRLPGGAAGSAPAGYLVECREMGIPDWSQCSDRTVNGTQLTVRGLHPNSTYVFRVFARYPTGVSDASEVSDLVQLRPKLHGTPRGVPAKPSPPELYERIADQVTLCWYPAHSSLPVQGYDVEFCDKTTDVSWYKVNDLLMQSCRMTIGDLQFGHEYLFRVIAKNAMGYSEPSDTSQAIVVGADVEEPNGMMPADIPAHYQDGYQQAPPQPPQSQHQQQQPCTSQQAAADEMPQQNGFAPPQPNSYYDTTPAAASNGHHHYYEPPQQQSQSQHAPPPPLHREQSYSTTGDPVTLPDEMARARESPVLPDRDDSPPPIHRPPYSQQDASAAGTSQCGQLQGVQWRDPTLPEVLEYLASPNNVIKLNAAGYLQHLTFKDNEMKRKTMELGGIVRLVDMLGSDIPEIQKNAAGCLRNMSYGRQNEDIKLAIRDAHGLQALVNLLRKTPDMQVKEEITGALWNLSSCDSLKQPILDLCADPIVRQVIVPGSGWSADGHHASPDRQYNPNVFCNATGVIKNVSAATDGARKILREMQHFLDSIVFYMSQAVMMRGEVDTTPVTNVICILRNVSFRCQEVDDPNFDTKPPNPANPKERSKSAPSGSPKIKQKFFKSKKTKDSPAASPNTQAGQSTLPAQGIALLWQPATVKVYLKLLSESSNSAVLEATAGVIQNIAACYWQPSIDLRVYIRQERGLPTLVELLRLPDDRVVCAVATALRNLALDRQNRDLIGKYAMADLVNKLPEPNRERPSTVSDATLCGVLAVLYETVVRSSEFTRNLHENGGTRRLMGIAQATNLYNPRVCRYASQVLHTMWQHRELHDLFKRAGLKDTDFFVHRHRPGGPAQGDMTLARPISTQGPERPATQSRLRPDIDPSRSGPPLRQPPPQQQQPGYGTAGAAAPVNGHHYDAQQQPTYAQVRKPINNNNNNNGYHHQQQPPVSNGHHQNYRPASHTSSSGGSASVGYQPISGMGGVNNMVDTSRSSLVHATQPAGDSWV